MPRTAWGIYWIHLNHTVHQFRKFQDSNKGKQEKHISCMLDVLTPLSDCRQETVEKMERRISGVSYMCWMDFHNGISCCGLLCARLISLSFVSLLFLFCVSFVSLFRLPRRGLPRPIYTPRAITPLPPLHGYHACVYIPAITPEYISTPWISHQSYHALSHT